MKNDGTMGAPDLWTIYLASSDADATVAAVQTSGGQTVVPVEAVGDLGRFAVVADPGGAGVGVWEGRSHSGFEVIGESGAPIWFELHTREYDASLAFYRDAFGWVLFTAVDTPEFRYTTHSGPDKQYAGVIDASQWRPEGSPAEWFVYFGVDDADKAARAGRRARRRDRRPGRGHAVRPPRHGDRPDRRQVQAARPERRRAPRQLTPRRSESEDVLDAVGSEALAFVEASSVVVAA